MSLPSTADTGEIVLRNRKLPAYGTLVFGGLLALGSLALLGTGDPLIIGGGFVCSGLCLAVGFLLLDARPKVRITVEGIEDYRLQTGLIPYSQITQVQMELIAADSYICLRLREPGRYPVRPIGLHVLMQPSRGKGPRLLDVNIYSRPLDMDPLALAELIAERAGVTLQ